MLADCVVVTCKTYVLCILTNNQHFFYAITHQAFFLEKGIALYPQFKTPKKGKFERQTKNCILVKDHPGILHFSQNAAVQVVGFPFLVYHVGMDKEQKKVYDIEYQKRNVKRIPLNLNISTDADIIAHIQAINNVNGYLKALIRQDIKRKKKQPKIANKSLILKDFARVRPCFFYAVFGFPGF